VLDVDRFKSINDTYGHDAGDTVLCYLANALRNTTRSSAELSFRTGGEEFAILMPGHVTPKELDVVTNRIKLAVNQVVLPEELNKVELTVSIGASWPKEEDTGWNAIYVRTDKAMYTAKRKGGNRALIDERL
jgi:diguanylate cyclase (GGDEF)-like protein